jgi:hypothetical protein
LTFQTTSLKKVKTNQYKLIGNLTMHGVTKRVTMDLTFRGTVPNPRSKKDVAGFHLSGRVALLVRREATDFVMARSRSRRCRFKKRKRRLSSLFLMGGAGLEPATPCL